jgi:hypothetical protein
MPKTDTPRKMGKKDINIYRQGMAKPGGKLDKAGVALRVSKNIAVPGSPKPPKAKEGDYLGEKGKGIIQTLKHRTEIEENKQERKAKKK